MLGDEYENVYFPFEDLYEEAFREKRRKQRNKLGEEVKECEKQ